MTLRTRDEAASTTSVRFGSIADTLSYALVVSEVALPKRGVTVLVTFFELHLHK